LYLDDLIADRDLLGGELHAHGRVVIGDVAVVDEHVQDRALPHRRVPDQDVLEDVVEVQTFLHGH
jgi:hypothetical protein